MIEARDGDEAILELFLQFESISSALGSSRPSDSSDLDAQFRKIAVLSCASALEYSLTVHMRQFFASRGEAIGEFARVHAVERKFHTWFDFTKPLPTKFFKNLGPACYRTYSQRLDQDLAFKTCCECFMALISARNVMIHSNLAEQSSDMTFEEVRLKYLAARDFPDLIDEVLASS